jgi:hypothetical protein
MRPPSLAQAADAALDADAIGAPVGALLAGRAIGGAALAAEAGRGVAGPEAGERTPHTSSAVSPAPASSPSDTASQGLGRARAAGAATTSGPNTSAAALSTTARFTWCCPVAQAPSSARPASRLMRRGTPRDRRWMRLSAAASKGSGPVCPATASRCSMYWMDSGSLSASR